MATSVDRDNFDTILLSILASASGNILSNSAHGASGRPGSDPGTGNSSCQDERSEAESRQHPVAIVDGNRFGRPKLDDISSIA